MKKPTIPKKELLLYIETGRQKVAEVLFRYPEKEFSLTELAEMAGVKKSNVGRILDQLLKGGFVEITKLSNIWRIKANQKNPEFIKSKIVYNLNFVYQSGLIEFLNDYFRHPKAIILFGSFRKGEDISSSDIDLAIEGDVFKNYKTISLRELSDFEKEAGRKIQIHVFNKEKVDINLFNNIANGIVLSGFLEVNL